MTPPDPAANERSFTADEERILSELGLTGKSRRSFLGKFGAAGLGLMAAPLLGNNDQPVSPAAPAFPKDALLNEIDVRLNVNGTTNPLTVDSRTTLLDALREHLELTGTKKGCNQGQCGACTVMIDGQRKLSCLTLAATCGDKKIKTVEGLATGDTLHPLQAAFLKHDGFQCGYCTPGQICSSVALLEEAKNGDASYVTDNLSAPRKAITLSEEEIRERMSGNICRCGAYNNIVAAIQEVHSGQEEAQPKWTFATKAEMQQAKG